MIVKLLTGHQLEFLSLKGNCRGSSESTLVKMPHCWKSHVTAQLLILYVDASLEASLVAYAASSEEHVQVLTIKAVAGDISSHYEQKYIHEP